VVVPTIADVSLITVRVILELGHLSFVAYQAFGA
jgi:hypothetical protein